MDIKKSIIPPSEGESKDWAYSLSLPRGASGLISAAGWTVGNEGFIQQTFLGASIRNFNLTAGFGDTSSTLSVQLVNDEYNKSDETGLGWGDDVYHNGKFDEFKPPQAGSPVFFKFGKNFATIESAWMKTYDDLYKTSGVQPFKIDQRNETTTLFNNFPNIGSGEFVDLEKSDRKNFNWSLESKSPSVYTETYKDYEDKRHIVGQNHLVFGGILQSCTQNNGQDANAAFSVQVVDPREILSNVVIVLNNYAGSVYNNKNYYNVYGFLEYDVTDELKDKLEEKSIKGFNIGPIESSGTWSDNPKYINLFPADLITVSGTIYKTPKDKQNNILEKLSNKETGEVYYLGNDIYRFPQPTIQEDFNSDEYFADDENNEEDKAEEIFPEFFPITGEGFSRRCDQGIPWYRVRQGLNALFNYYLLPQEYKKASFGGYINFRGYNYIVDFSGIPIENIPKMYFLNFDQIDLLSLCQELCDVISHDMFVSLLPVIDHPACKLMYDYNKSQIAQNKTDKIIAGIIRIDAIDKSKPPKVGAIKEYLEDMEKLGVEIESKDLGYELSNITTDKLVVGAQEVEMYYFNNNKDRDSLQLRKFKAGVEDNSFEWLNNNQWSLEVSLKQQILPFYGFLGKDAITVPRGFGSYQQILLDSSGLEAHGVGNYYVATEMELRAALISYEQWKDFLLQYDETFMEEIGDDFVFWNNIATESKQFQLNESLYGKQSEKVINALNELANREFGVSVPRCVFRSDRNYMGEDGYPASPCAPPYGYPLYYKRAEKIGIPQAGILNILNKVYDGIAKIEELKKSTNSRNELLTTRAELSFDLANLKDTSLNNGDDVKLLKEINEIEKKLQEIAKDDSEATYINNTFLKDEKIVKNLEYTARQNEKNAKKVYEFVKNIAETHLGRTFLVKIPKQCNVNYEKNIKDETSLLTIESNNVPPQVNSIISGPFGFKPMPVFSGIGYYESDENLKLLLKPFIEKSKNNYSFIKNDDQPEDLNDTFHHYLDFDKPKTEKYTYGALKNNFNPISEKWEFNYNPEPQGGFFEFSLFEKNLTLNQIQNISGDFSLLQKQLLGPMDLSNFINDQGKISCYVRYDHSQFLDLSSINSDSFSQQIIPEYGDFIPDILEELDNIDKNQTINFDEVKEYSTNPNYKTKKDCVAFVKCQLDENFYMVPKFKKIKTEVFGRTYQIIPAYTDKRTVEYNDECGNKKIGIISPYYTPIIIPGASGGTDGTFVDIFDFDTTFNELLDGDIINVQKEKLDPEHVYALITIPGRITPTITQRYLDGPQVSFNGVSIKHIMTSDVVRGAPGFDSPSPIVGNIENLCKDLSYGQLASATILKNRTNKDLAFSLANAREKIGYVQPSPVYPDLVALPLMSRERCYGPWFSASILGPNERLKYSDIGGKVEFVKDENLSPWNYAGYQLMNEAGSLQAQFSNSLLLYSERGGFVIPDMPYGISLARHLKEQGPLVTSISIDISDSVKTTVKMDLYTSRFGKLQKQKEEAIAQIVREKQKARDQNNLMIRKGLINDTKNNNLMNDKNIVKAKDILSNLEKKQPASDTIISSTTKDTISGIDIFTNEELQKSTYGKSTSLVPQQDIDDALNLLDTNQKNNISYKSAKVKLNEFFVPYSKEPNNPYMPSEIPIDTNLLLEKFT